MRHLSMLSMAFLLAACSGPPSSSGADAGAGNISPADSAAVAAVSDRLSAAARAANWDAWGAEYVENAVRFPPNAPALVGKTAVDAYNDASPRFSSFDAKVTFVAGKGDMAVASGTFKVSAPAGKDAAGKATPAFSDVGKFMQFLTKQGDGSWKISRDMWNSDGPTAATATK